MRLRAFPLVLLAAALAALPAGAATFAELRARFEREKGQDFQTRYKTLNEIAELNTVEALRFLEGVAKDDADSSIRSNALYSLARVNVPEAAQVLLRFYREFPPQRSSVLSAWTNYRDEALPADIVDEILGGSDVSNRSSVIRYFAKRRDPRFLKEAQRFLDEFPGNASSITSTLTQYPSPETGRMLVASYDDTRSYDREQIPKFFTDAAPEIRAVLPEAIRIGREPLLTQAAQIAARAKVAEAEEALVAAAKAAKDPSKKAMLVEACGAVGLGTEEGRALVLELLRSPKPEVAVAAIRAIRAGPVAEAVPVLIGMMRSEEGILRVEVRVTLERITGQQFGDRVDIWEAWWRDYGDTFDPKDVKPPAADLLDQALVDLAIEKGAAALRAAQAKDGKDRSAPWVYAGHPVGTTALVLLALHAAGTEPRDRPFATALKWLVDQSVPEHTYDAGLVAMALETIGGKKYRTRIAEAARHLVSWQNTGGFWGYPTGDGDHSNSQYAVLGLRSAARAGIAVPAKTWASIRDHFLATQNEDGGWNYVPRSRKDVSSSSMSSAGVTCLLICLENMELDEAGRAEILAAIDRGFDALGNLMKLDKDSLYALYGIERAGVLGSRSLMGGNPWYVPGAKRLVEEQGRDGFWRGQYHEAVDSAFAILFLKKATAPLSTR